VVVLLDIAEGMQPSAMSNNTAICKTMGKYSDHATNWFYGFCCAVAVDLHKQLLCVKLSNLVLTIRTVGEVSPPFKSGFCFAI